MPCPLSESMLGGCGEPSCLWAPLGQPQTTLQVMCLGGEGTQRWGYLCCHLIGLHHQHQNKQSCAGPSGTSSSKLWDPLPDPGPLKILDDVSQSWHHCSNHIVAQHSNETALSALILPVQDSSCFYIYKAFSQLLPSHM